MSTLAAPPDGLIARRFRDLEPGLSDDGADYFYRCLLAGMRSDELPHPRKGALTAMDAVLIRDKVNELLPRIERIRAGEEPLLEPPPVEPTEELPF